MQLIGSGHDSEYFSDHHIPDWFYGHAEERAESTPLKNNIWKMRTANKQNKTDLAVDEKTAVERIPTGGEAYPEHQRMNQDELQALISKNPMPVDTSNPDAGETPDIGRTLRGLRTPDQLDDDVH